jgi:hypothetical protein
MKPTRRQVLAIAVSGLAGSAGCLGSGDDTDPKTREEVRSTIKAVVEFYYANIEEGNADQFLSLVHPDSITETFNPTPMFGRFSVEVDSLTVLELDRESETAVVEASVRAVATDETESRVERLELRIHEGEWHIWLDDPDPFDVD